MTPAQATIIAALVSAAAAIIVGLITSNAQHKKVLEELDKHSALQLYRIEQLEKKQDKHNEVIERTYELESRAALLERDMKVANHRISDLERKGA